MNPIIRLKKRKIEEIENADGKINIPDLNKKIPVLSNLFSLKLERKNFIFKTLLNNLTLIYLYSIYFTLPAGFEPAAHCLEGSCSIQLS